MSASLKAKAVLAAFLRRTGVHSRWLNKRPADQTAILMYHRVIPRSETDHTVQPGMVIEPDTLDVHVSALRRHFEIVSLSEIASAAGRSAVAKPRCVLTFDDGWCDFYRHAYPILRKHEAPATVFLPTQFIGTDRWFWTDCLGHLLNRAGRDSYPEACSSRPGEDLAQAIAGASGSPAARLEKAIALLKAHPLATIERVLADLAARGGGEATPTGRAFLNWNEVREMAATGLVAFGSHTARHQLLTTLTDDQVRHELEASMNDLIVQKAASASFVAFSYPNGDFSQHHIALVREAGYRVAVTTRRGWHAHGTNPYAIPRIAVHQDIAATEAMLESRIAGLW